MTEPAEPSTHTDASATAPTGSPAEDASTGASPVEAFRKGGPKVFMLLTCGFLALLCCVGGCLGGGALGVTRANNLDDARSHLSFPTHWKSTDESNWPWAAYATLSGPTDPALFEAWLTENGATYDPSVVEGCLAATEPCELDIEVDGFTASITYHGGDEAVAEVTVR